MEFLATSVEYWSDGGAETVFFGNEEQELALVLSNIPGTKGHTCEWNDQSNVVADAVKSVQLTGRTLRIEILAKAAKQLGESSFTIELECDDALRITIIRQLTTIFRTKFSAPRPAPGAKKAAAAAPARDYSKIRYLNLEGKNLKVLPEDVKLMTALETAKLGRNPKLDLDAVCEVLSQMPALRELTFSTDRPVPESIGKLTQLESLELTGFTKPQVLPESIGKLTKLRSILIMSDSDVVLPDTFAELEGLERLNVRAESWRLPKEFYRLKKLTDLDLGRCRVGRAPEEMTQMTAVTCVALGRGEGCDYEQILSVVARMPNVRRIELGTNPVPKAIGQCRQIQELVIWAGVRPEKPLVLPEEMFALGQLEKLVMSRNFFREIPEGLGRLKGLQTLAIDESEFEALPESIGELTNLTFLNLSENPSMRALPESLGKLLNLKSLNLRDNPGLTRLPDSVKALTALERVDLSGTDGVDNVPEAWKAILA